MSVVTGSYVQPVLGVAGVGAVPVGVGCALALLGAL